MTASRRKPVSQPSEDLKLYLVPCSCGTTFAVPENYDHQGTAWSRYLKCPICCKRHDPKNRLLQLGFRRAGYWKRRGVLKDAIGLSIAQSATCTKPKLTPPESPS